MKLRVGGKTYHLQVEDLRKESSAIGKSELKADGY